MALTLASPAAASRPTNVLFVCHAGTAKSAIAREFFRRRARERGISVTTSARGIAVEDHLSVPLRRTLAAEGIDPTRDVARALNAKDVDAADIVVAFTPLPPALTAKVARDWTSLPSVNNAWPSARSDLVRRIEALLDEIAAKQSATP